MAQLTFQLEYWRDGEQMTIVDGKPSTRPCPDFQEQIAEKLKQNPSYKYSSFIDVPNNSVNVKKGILILNSTEPSEDFDEKRNQIIAMLYQNMENYDAKETLKLVDELIDLK